MENRELGVALAMTYTTILSTAHLYNAVRQSNLLPVAWRDMEYLTSLHKPQHLFFGGYPTTPEGFLKRFRLAFGLNVSNFAPNRKPSRLYRGKNIRSERNTENMYPLCSIFRGRYCQSERQANLAIDNLNKVITSAATKVGKGSPLAFICEQWAKTRSSPRCSFSPYSGMQLKMTSCKSILIIYPCICVARLSSKLHEAPSSQSVQLYSLLQLRT